jgi:hypothetical protein
VLTAAHKRAVKRAFVRGFVWHEQTIINDLAGFQMARMLLLYKAHSI